MPTCATVIALAQPGPDDSGESNSTVPLNRELAPLISSFLIYIGVVLRLSQEPEFVVGTSRNKGKGKARMTDDGESNF